MTALQNIYSDLQSYNKQTSKQTNRLKINLTFCDEDGLLLDEDFFVEVSAVCADEPDSTFAEDEDPSSSTSQLFLEESHRFILQYHVFGKDARSTSMGNFLHFLHPLHCTHGFSNCKVCKEVEECQVEDSDTNYLRCR